MSTYRTHKIYNNHQWKTIRRLALARDSYQCQLKLPGCTGHATQADHKIALEDGGEPYDLTNTQASCRHCNVTKENMRRQRTSHTNSRQW